MTDKIKIIVNAYVSRLHSSQLKLLYEQSLLSERASNHLSLNAQAIEHNNSLSVISDAIDTLTKTDIDLITKTIEATEK